MSTSFDKGYALLIGVSDQKNPNHASILPETANDVHKLAQVLTDPSKSGYLPENVVTLLGTAATRTNIFLALIELQEKLAADPTATAIIYFSGHGYRQTATGKYFLVPYDFNLKLAADTGIEDRVFAEKIGTVDAKRLLLLLDCCHAGATNAGINIAPRFTEEAANIATFVPSNGFKPVEEDERPPTPPNGSKPVEEDERPPTPPNGSKPVEEDERPPTPPNGSKPTDDKKENNTEIISTRAVLASSRGSEFSFVHSDKAVGMSIFTYHLIEALNGHGKSKAEDTVVNVLDLMSHVLDSVPKTTKAQYGHSQTPNARYIGEDFPIALLMGGEGLPKDQDPPSVASVVNNITDNSRRNKVIGDHNVVVEKIDTGGGDVNIGNSTTKASNGVPN